MKTTAELNPADITAAVAVADAELRRALLEALQEVPAAVIEDNCEAGTPDELVAAAERLEPAVVFFGLPGFKGDVKEAIARLGGLECGPRVVVVNDCAESGAILKAMRAGAAEFVYPPFDSGFQESMRRVLGDCSREQHGRATGSVIGFVSAKGGCGATTIACHTASHLRREARKEVLLADLDTSSGIAGMLMQTVARYTLSDALDNLHRMDLKLWKAMVAAAPSGVDVIPASIDSPPHALAALRRLPQMLRFWRNNYDQTILDFGHGITQPLMESLDSLDMVVVAATNELPALRQARQMIQALALRNFGANRLKLVINRMPRRVQIEVPELEKAIGHPIHCTLPNDYHALSVAYSEPRLLGSDSELGRRLGEFAGNLTGIAPVEKKARRLFAFR